MTKEQAIAVFQNLCNKNIVDAYNERIYAIDNSMQHNVIGFNYCFISDSICGIRIFNFTENLGGGGCEIRVFYNVEMKRDTDTFKITLDEYLELKKLYYNI